MAGGGVTAGRLRAARGAFERSDWAAALEALRTVDCERSLEADDLERAGECAMWVGDFELCIEYRQRAFALRVGSGEKRQAAGLAMELCRAHATRDRLVVADGWGRRAQRLLEDVEPCLELGWLAELGAIVALHMDHDVSAAEEGWNEALRIARAFEDADLAAAALVGLGTVRVRVGDVAGGLHLVDEAMTDAVSGRLGPITTARVYCNTISLCQALGDLRRAYEWTEEAVACATRPGTSDFPGDCRLHRAELMRLRGDWTGAEIQLRRAMVELERWDLSHVGQAWYELGEIALRRGDLGGAEEAFNFAESYGKDPLPGLASLRLAQSNDAAASALLRTAASNAPVGDPLLLGQLLPSIVDVQLAIGDQAGAVAASNRLRELAVTYRTVVFEAQAAVCAAKIALVGGRLADALASARAAVSLWRDAGAPYETAQAQTVLADAASRIGDDSVAMMELDAALVVFAGLGATRDTEATQQLRNRLGQPQTGHRVRRTFVFTDVVDSTRLVATMGDERWPAILRWHDRTIREILARHGGSEVKQRGGGDGFFAVFETPSDAISCATEVQRRFRDQRDTGEFAPEVRIGVHEADALLSGNDFAGLGVHEAARIAGIANGGEIIASAATVASAACAEAERPTAVTLKGLPAPISVCQIQWAATTNDSGDPAREARP